MFEDENSHLTINAGARLRVWQGRITNNDCESVSYFIFNSVLESNEGPSCFGEFLLHPDVTVNNHPQIIERMTTPPGKDSDGNVWHRFGTLAPLSKNAWTKIPSEEAWLFGWDYEKQDWSSAPGSKNLNRFVAYTVSTNYIDGNVIFVIESNSIGNDNINNFSLHQGYNFLGNSYTAKIDIKNLIDNLPSGSSKKVLISHNKETSIEKTTGKILPSEAFIIHKPDASGVLTASYKDLVWDPSFEEEVTPTRSLLKGALTSSKLTEIDATLEGSGIFDNPDPVFLQEHDEK